MIPARAQLPLGVVVVAIAAILPFGFSDFVTSQILTRALILGIAAASMIFLDSLGGGVSLAQTGLYGLAGFTYGNLIQADGGVAIRMGVYPALLLALLITVGVALLIGLISSRSEGIYFLMITLAFGVIIKLIFEKVTDMSGFGGINNISAPSWLENPALQPDRLYWLALVLSVLVYLGYRYFAKTPFGLAFQGNRDNPTRMKALGYNIIVIRTVAFGIGGFIAAVAGVLNVWWNTAIAPGTIDLGPIIYLLLIAIIGGLYRIEGAWIGALIFALIDNRLRSIGFVGDRTTTAIGIIFLLIVLLSPGGVMGIYESISKRLRSRPTGGGDIASAGGDGAAAPQGVAGD